MSAFIPDRDSYKVLYSVVLSQVPTKIESEYVLSISSPCKMCEQSSGSTSAVHFFGTTLVLRKMGGTECPYARLLIEERQVLNETRDACIVTDEIECCVLVKPVFFARLNGMMGFLKTALPQYICQEENCQD